MGLFSSQLDFNELNQRWLPKLDQDIGLRLTRAEDDALYAEWVVSDKLVQPFGIMHGGVTCVVGESLGSIAGNLCLKNERKTVVGQSLLANHLRPAPLGTRLEAKAQALHVGARSQVWEIIIKDLDRNRLVSKVTLTLAVIDVP